MVDPKFERLVEGKIRFLSEDTADPTFENPKYTRHYKIYHATPVDEEAHNPPLENLSEMYIGTMKQPDACFLKFGKIY